MEKLSAPHSTRFLTGERAFEAFASHRTWRAERFGEFDIRLCFGEEELGVAGMAWQGESMTLTVTSSDILEADLRICPTWDQKVAHENVCHLLTYFLSPSDLFGRTFWGKEKGP